MDWKDPQKISEFYSSALHFEERRQVKPRYFWSIPNIMKNEV